LPTAHPKVWATRSSEVPADLPAMLDDLYAAAAINDPTGTVARLRAMLPDYQPSQQLLPPVTAGAPYADGF
jgi:hypothetical protein